MQQFRHWWSQTFGVGRTLRRLQHDNPVVRERADRRFWRTNLTTEDALRVIKATSEPYPDKKTSYELLRRFWDEPFPECVPAIEEVYDSLDKYPDARESALRVLTEMMSKESLRAVARLLKRNSSRTLDLSWVFVPLTGGYSGSIAPKGVDLIVELMRDFDRLDEIEHRSGLLDLLLEYANAGYLEFDHQTDFVNWSIARCRRLLDEDMPDFETLISPGFSDLDPQPFGIERIEHIDRSATELEFLFDVMRFFAVPDELLRRGCELRDPELRLFAIIALMTHDADISDSQLLELARNPSLRCKLWIMLGRIDQQDRFPAEFGNQESLAEAEMVQWLEHPMEMAKPPEEIERLQVLEVNEKEIGPCAVYFFRFRHSEFLDGQWLVGMAGPYSLADPPTMSGYWTFSQFKPWATNEAEAIAELMQRVEDD